MDWIPIGISSLALVVSISAELRVRRSQIAFEVSLDTAQPGRITLRNAGSRTVRKASIMAESLAGVGFPVNHLEPKTLIPGGTAEVWVNQADADRIPHTVRVRFGQFRRGLRDVPVPNLADGAQRPLG